jgi:hypothetical protein
MVAWSCISNNKLDFIELSPMSNTVLKGIGRGLHIAGTGNLWWNITDDSGDEISLHIRDSLYVPTAPMCLLSLQSVAQQTTNSNDGFLARCSHGKLIFSVHTKTIHYNSQTNLPIFFTASDLSYPAPNIQYLASSSPSSYIASDITTNITNNLIPIQLKLLLKHQQLGHLQMSTVQKMANEGLFGAAYKSIANCDIPLCKACIHAKQHKRPSLKATLQPLDTQHLAPGDCVSGDQIESTQPGLIPAFEGFPSTSFYHAGTLLVDHASHFLHFSHTSQLELQKLFQQNTVLNS